MPALPARFFVSQKLLTLWYCFRVRCEAEMLENLMRRLSVYCCLLGLAYANAAHAQVTFGKIADNTTPRPGSTALFGGFRHASISGNTVAFTAFGTNTWVYTGTVGSVGASLIAHLGTSAGSDGTFINSSMGPVSAISANNIVFKGGTSLGGLGVYAGVVGSIGAGSVANNHTAWPTNPSLNLVNFEGGPSVSGDKVVFAVRGGNGSAAANGIFTATIGSAGISVIADSTTPVPGQPLNFSSAFTSGQAGDGGSPSISGNNVAFLGNWTDGGGIYTGTAGVRGASLIVDTTTPAPGTTANFIRFGIPVISGTNLAYAATYAGGSGVFMSTFGSTGATRIVDRTMLIPGTSTNFSGFLNVAISGDKIAFHEDHGIFFAGDGVVSRVILIGDTLFGSTVTSVHLGQNGYADPTKQVAFCYELANGERGLATAYVGAIPEPAMLSTLPIALASVWRRYRGR
jgi:hypothetical protein